MLAFGLAVYVQTAIDIENTTAEFFNVSPGFHPIFKNQLNKLEPIIMQTIKHEKIIPRGTSLFLGMRRTGVPKKINF